MTTAAVRRFPATTSSVGQARRFLLAQLPGASDGESDALVLMLSELATNAVQHAATEFEVQVQVAPDGHRVRVEVTDGAAGFPTPQEQVADAPHGRGLHIVRTLADTWGIEMRRDQPGKTVWFSLPLAGQRAVHGARATRPGQGAPADVTSATAPAAPAPGARQRRQALRWAETNPPGPSKGSGWYSTGCATRSWPPTTRA